MATLPLWCIYYVCSMLSMKLAMGAYSGPSHTYHNHEALTNYLNDVQQYYSTISHVYSIGQTVQGRELWVIAVAGGSADSHMILRPEVKYVGNMHGNEAVSRELLIHFIHYLVTNYGTNDDVTNLLDSARIHVLVSMNPDGFERAYTRLQSETCGGVNGRNNGNGMDLNRNFEDYFQHNSARTQPETEAVMGWLNDIQFVLSANLHGGALVANYPYDNTARGSTRYSACPDDDVFRHLAATYADAHAEMSEGSHCGERFRGGITNGAAWYAIIGSMQDYNYIYAGCMEITIEVACCKYPDESKLESYWLKNRDALLNFLQQTHMGVKGVVRDSSGNPLEGASITVMDREQHDVTTTQRGEYWRLLLPGAYTLKVELSGYVPKQEVVSVVSNTVTILNITMATLSNPREGTVTPSVVLNITVAPTDHNPTEISAGAFTMASIVIVTQSVFVTVLLWYQVP